jgi:multidrug efflux system outer membrane protein
MNRALLAAAALSAAACSFAPKYQRPDAGVPQEFRLVKASEAASIADLPWWEFFRDPVLQGLIREALANNQDLALAVARVEQSRALVGVAKADLYPQINGNVTGGYGDLSTQTFPGSKTGGRYTINGNVSWLMDLWGQVRNSRDAAYADLLATEDGRRAVVLSLVSGIAQAYVELRALDLQLEIAKSNTETRRGTLELFEARAAGGAASDLEVNQARSDLAVTLAAIPQTQILIWIQEHQISVLLGRAPSSIPRGTALVDMPAAPDLPAGVPAQLLTRRPDVLAAEQNIIAAGNRVGVAVANRLPALSLTGFIGLDATNVPDLFTPGALTWNAGAALFAPIFQGFRLASLEAAARAVLDQTIASYRKTVEVALQEVADASAGVAKFGEVRAAFEMQVKATTASVDLARGRYEGGVASYLDVLDAQRRLYEAQLNLQGAIRDQLTSFVQLYRALGGGWQYAEPVVPETPPPGGKPPPPPAKPPAPPTQPPAQPAAALAESTAAK